MMRAMVLEKPGPIERSPLQRRDLQIPEVGPDRVLIRVKACGICHTDLHTVEGELPLPRLPLVPGHQIVGEVEKAGEAVTKYSGGERVGVPWLQSTCGKCEFCRRGEENLCESARFTGYHVDGGYAEYTAVQESSAFPLPDAYSDQAVAPLLCGGVIGFRAFRSSEVKPGQRLGLWGFGASAHIVIQVAIHCGCEVLVFTRTEAHRRLASSLGASWVGGPDETPPRKVHSGVIFAPAGHLVLNALRALEKGGTLVLAGIYMTPIPEIDYTNLLYYEKRIRSVTASTRKDVTDLLKLAPIVPVKTEVETFRLEDANHALALLKRSAISGSGVLLPVSA
jgi:propanol-preferring alcohol dehydrogenase